MKRRIALFVTLMVATTLSAQGVHSVLGSGRWWRLQTSQTGVYGLTVSQLPSLKGVSVDSIAVYAGPVGQLPLKNSLAPTADLQPVAIDIVDRNGNGVFDSADAVLFFGEGTDRWQWNDNTLRWQLQRHAYANANYYFLTTSRKGLRISDAMAVGNPDTVLSTYTAVTCVNNDINSPGKNGQIWLGDRFTSTTTTRSYTLALPSAAAGEVLLRFALASYSTTSAAFTLSCGSWSRSIEIAPTKIYSTTLEQCNLNQSSFNFRLVYTPRENSATGYLDYIEVNAPVTAAMNGNQMIIRNNPMGTTAAMHLSGAAGCTVWDVTEAGRERRMPLSMTGSTAEWTDTLSVARTYIAFNGSSFLTPESVSEVTHQDLHGAEAADYVIVTNALFLEQARRLAALHEIMDGVSTLVVSDVQVFNEFSSGKQDPMAIRALLRHLKKSHPDRPPRWLLLFGKGVFDNRNILNHNLPTVVTYQTEDSWDWGDRSESYGTDDVLGYLDDSETGLSGTGVDVAIGRMPAQSVAEAKLLVDKVECYVTRADLQDDAAHGDWRNHVAMLSDDADKSSDVGFVVSSESTATHIKTTYPEITIDRLFADAYHQESGAIGSYYPDLNNALRNRIDNGCLILTYIGHGSINYIGTERFIQVSDIASYKNRRRWPLLVASTCSYGRYDLVDERCGSEEFVLADGGAIGTISASDRIPHYPPFFDTLMIHLLKPGVSMGEALMNARNVASVSPSVCLLGDPALCLSRPENRVVVTQINHQPVDPVQGDTAEVLSRVTVGGEIQSPDGSLIADFDGVVLPVVYDRETRTATLDNDQTGSEVEFCQQKNVLYKGNVPVESGRFEYSFIVPRDVAYQYAPGRLAHYAASPTEHAAGAYLRLFFGGLNEEAALTTSQPTIRLFIGDTNFRSGGLTDENPTLLALLSDSVGINAVGSGLGHDITAVLDGNANALVVLNDLFQPSADGSSSGTVRYTFSKLEPGLHTLTLKAWNIFNNSSSATITFRVSGEETTEFSTLAVFPNPATDFATFHFETSDPSQITSAVLQIFNGQGRLMQSITPSVSADGYVVGPVKWSVAGVPPGIYLGRMLVTTADGQTHQSATKCIVR